MASETTSKEVIEERVYIGNVVYKATKDELKDLFTGLNVIDVEIPTKNVYSGKQQSTKPLGFAFVQFETKEEADQVIENYNGRDFKGRKIYVKKANPSLTEEEKAKKLEDFKAKKAAEKAEKKAQKAKKAAAAKAEKKEKKKDEVVEKAAQKPSSTEAATTKESTKEPAAQDAAATAAAPTKAPAKALKKHVAKPKVPLEQGKKSSDCIFITNLAFEVKLKTLQNLFQDYNPVWIHVPTRKVPIKLLQKQKLEGKSRRNKGIAFVKFADEALQKKAIEEFNGTEINGRKIVVDVAIDARAPVAEANGEEDEASTETKETDGEKEAEN